MVISYPKELAIQMDRIDRGEEWKDAALEEAWQVVDGSSTHTSRICVCVCVHVRACLERVCHVIPVFIW